MLTSIKALPFTFFSPGFYSSLVRNWAGIGIGFIVLLTAISYAVINVALIVPGQKIIEAVPEIAGNLPEMTIKDHKLSIDRPSPYYVQFSKGETDPAKPSPILIDTGYKATDLSALNKWMNDYHVALLVTADQAIIRENAGRDIKVYDFSSIPDTVIDHDKWLSYGRKATFWIPLIVIITMALVLFTGSFIKVLFGALLLLLIDLFTHSMPTFDAKMRIAAATTIPPGLICLLLPHIPWFKSGLWIGYLIFGAVAARRSVASATSSRQPPRYHQY